jgi:hypothetical protein
MDDEEIPHHPGDAAPVLAVVTEQLHLVHTGADLSRLFHSWTVGSTPSVTPTA